jgi:hypothetical protein
MTGHRSEAFNEGALLDRASRKAGLSDFGDAGFREPLRVLLASLAKAPLNAIGETVLRASISRSLGQRLLAEDWFRRHPEIEDEEIVAPLVVVGMMRSGTTLIQRLLARDPRCYSALGWEIAEPAPRPDWRPDAPDPRIAAGEERSRQMREFAPQLHAIHPTDALEADEEIVFLADAFLSHIPEASCDVADYRSWLDDQDFTPAYRWLRRMLQLLQWQKRQRGEQRERWVLKTPAHLGYLNRLFAAFPDATVIHTHRSPLETIPSGASLNLTLWRMYADDVDPKEVGRQWIERMTWATRRALAYRDGAPDAAKRFVDIGYREAVADPLAAVTRIYQKIGVDLLPDARAAMQRWLRGDARERRPAHRYSAEEFGLTESDIREAFTDYIERFIDPSAHG